MKIWITYLCSALIVSAISAKYNPLRDPSKCGNPTCDEEKDASEKFRYMVGTQHKYKYFVQANTLFQGTSKNESKLYIEATVQLEFLTKCDGLLKVSDVRLRDEAIVDAPRVEQNENEYEFEDEEKESGLHENSNMFSESLSEFPLRFEFQDGMISEVCSYDEEKQWVMNFKKGLLSMMHNTMRRFDLDYETDEEDIRGKCQTSYKILGTNETSLIVEKTKNLNTCIGRSKFHSMVQSTPYNFKVNNQEQGSLLRSRSRCELSIDHHIYNEINCEETHVFEPFANKASGATTILRQRLLLLSEEPETVDDQPDIESRFSLIYDHVPTPKPTSKELKTSRDLIKKLCQLSTEDVDMVFSDLFTKFIHTSRILSYPAISALYGHSATLCPTGKKHLLEALPYLGSNAAVSLMTDVILKGGLPEETVREWIVHIALIPRPDASMMNSVSELLQSRDDPSTVLGIAAITYTYCKQNENCRNDENVDSIIQKFEERITETYNDRRSDRVTEETILVTLKAIANIGVTSEQFNEKLRDMIEDDTLQISIRVAAIDAHRRFDCESSRSYFEQIFRNEVEDVEVRIASYLQVMRCPTYLVMRTIKHTLEHEEVNQVGSFVWSHLHNLLKSSIPSRVEIQGMLSDDDLSKKFSSDMRKFSHNFEGSVFFEDYNVGANYESNVIFSPSSYVPKSAMLNLTVDLFGESVNMFEVYGRMEGFEHYLESVFGAKGPLSTKKFRDHLPIPIPNMRWARDISDDEQLKSEIDTVQNANQKNHGEPKVSLGMKLFGNEIKYATFNGDEEIKQALADLNPADHLKRILSGKEINYSNSAMFLDSSYVVSSGAGLPVTLNAIGTTSISMQLRGSLKANNFIKTKELELVGNVKPSIVVDIVGSMSLDAYYATTGIKLKTSMYTSSAVEGHVKIKGAKLVSIKFGIPKRNIDIFAAKSELYVMKGSEEIQQEGQKEAYVTESACSWPAVEKTVGLQMCVDYHFSNVTQVNNASYFILAGPAGFRLSLQKTDPTATTYLLEYKWVEKSTGSYASITFDTPGSSARRVLSANLTIDSVSRNLTVQFQSTEGTALARGRYKNTEMEKYLQFALDINEETNFDMLVSLEKQEIRNGFMFHPRCYLAIKDDRIADLEGTVKQITKSGISQYDVDLKFKTKRLNSKLYGYISRDDASVSSTLKFTYKFQNTKEHIVLTDFSLSNRSTKNIFVLHGDAKVTASAYPNYNFNSTFSLQRSGGHIESKFIINSSPHLLSNLNDDPEMLTVQMFLSYRTLTNGTRFKVSGAVSRLSTELDVKGQLSYDVIGYSTNAMALVRYNKGKDIVITVYWHHPRQTLETIDGRLNVTIPGFVPMVLEGKLKEKNSGDYAIDLSCTWFSGHSMSSTGLYQDRSTPLAANHHLKLVVRSPSFKDINAICHFYRNNTEIMIDIKADQQDEQYALYWKHVQNSKNEIFSIGRVMYKSKLYSITSSVSLKEKRQIRLEVHIDQIRDIYLSMWIDNKEARKEAGLELKWDANRDPNQKLAVTVYYAYLKPYNYEANFYISYPGRNIRGQYLFVINENHFLTLAQVAWTPDDAFSVSFEVNYKNGAETMIMIQTELLTPFDDWKRTSLSGGYLHSENSYRLNGSMHWQQNQHISIDLFADYFAKDSVLRCEFTGSLDSTVRDISSLSASVKHSQNTTKVDSELYLMYQPKEKIALTSSWEILQDSHMKNLTGVVTLVSPFKGFNKGLLVSKLLVTNSRTLRGVANLDLDHREFTVSVDGNFQRLTKNMLVFNITTPIDKFKNIHGRIGLSEENRYLVAMVDYPSGKTGVEIRFQVVSFSDLDMKFNLATPIEFLQEVLIVAKLKPEMADFRIGWNSLVAGFSGVWHYTDIMNFEYAYKIFTPIDGFKENGIVAKLIYKEGLDMELSTKFAQNKLGMIILGKPKPKILKELGIKTQAIYKNKLNVFSGFLVKQKTDKVDDGEHEEDPINWSGYIELNTLIYPTMTAEIDIDQKGTVYDVGATLKLPAGKAEFRDEFDYIDLLNMRNKFNLVTPYPWFKEITSNYELKISMDREYLVSLDLDYLNGTRWIKMGTLAHYIRPADQEDDTVYNITFHVHTPFKTLPLLDINGALALDDNTYHTNFSMVTNSSDIAFVGDLELDDGSVEMEITSHAITPVLLFPASKLFLKKYNSSDENRIECQYLMVTNRTNKFNLVAVWNYKTKTDLRVYVNMETPFKGLEKTEAAIELHAKDSRNVLARAKLVLFPIDLKANATIRDNDLRSIMFVDFSGSRHVMTLNGTTRDVGKGNRELTGVMAIDDKKHNITALLGIENELPSSLQLKMTPHNGGSPLTLDYKLVSGTESYIMTSSLKQASNFMTFKGKATVRREYDWDMHLEIETSHQRYKTFIINSKAASSVSNKSIAIDAKTPFERLENIQMGISFAQLPEEREARGFYVLGDTNARLCTRWTWLLFENMNVKLMGNYKRAKEERTAAINAFYVNPNKTFSSVRVGGNVDINNIWIMAGNLTFGRPGPNKVDLIANMQLPKPSSELHTVTGKFYRSKDLSDIEYLAKYNTLKSAKNFGSSGHLRYQNEKNMNADVLMEYYDKNVHNYVDIREKDDMVHLIYKLRTPKFQQEALIMKATYIKLMNYHNVTGELFYPGNTSVANGNLNFKEFANMNGFVNVSTPIEGLNYTGVNFNTETNPSTYNRYVNVFWPTNNALLDSKCITTEVDGSALSYRTEGLLLLEVPLATRHIAKVDYEYNKKPLNSTGHATAVYNKDPIFEAIYNCLSKSKAGFDKDTVHVEVQNKWLPVGADYIHSFEYNSPGDGTNMPTMDEKHINVYQLNNRSALDVTGDLHIHTRSSGQEITVIAIHSNRTVKLITNYDILEQKFKQNSRMELGPTAWIAYELDILNKTNDASSEAQEIQMNLSYPRRNFTAVGSYNLSENALSSEMALAWDKEVKTVQAGFDWTRDTIHPNRQTVLLGLKHPSFEKNITIFGEYAKTDRVLADVKMSIDYSLDPEKMVKLSAYVANNANQSMPWNYTYRLWTDHRATNLNLNVQGGIFHRPRWYYSRNLVDYKRTYLPVQSGEGSVRLDLDQHELELKRKTLHELSYLWAKYAGKFPLYTANMSAIHGEDIDAAGSFYLNIKEKLLLFEVNKTADASQSLHMHGYIPDARSAYFDIWRNFEDIRISDVSYFLLMNHSRLLVSSLQWRPELKQDLKDGIREVSVGMYNYTMERSEYWRQYIRSETGLAISGIWEDCKPHIQYFLNDVKDLVVIEEDLEELKVFLNNSYNANEFYIKDITNFMTYVIDELSIRSHIESLPAIVNEIWDVMGESGKKIQKGIVWVIEKIKGYYKNAAEFVNGIFQGDSLGHFSEALKELVEKYDTFIKDMHVAFIRYMEQLWKQTHKMILDNWHKTLVAIEPTFIKMIHYLETIAWNASKEFLDFIYIRKSEIIENPYYGMISNLTHDMGIFYKEMTGNDTIGATYKYTKVAWKFVKEKYFKLVPFGQELQDIIDEITNEVSELKNMPSIRYVLDRYNKIEERVTWFYDYFDIEGKVHRLITLIHLKVTDMKQTALQAENKYREAKTKFIFEPAEGIMHLEQKLPMSWHAFNETPNFEEIPEYKTFADLQGYFTTSKMTFSNFYHDYKPFIDPSDWLPPFKAQAMLVGSQYYVTFDRQVYNFDGDCTYLLASDFLDRNFSIAVSYKNNKKVKTNELLVVVHDTVIRIDTFANNIQIGNDKATTRLPYQIGDTSLYQEAEIFKLESKMGFELQCNMKFNVCAFEVSGWYFGKTAGLWGTMNNEPFDDLSAPNKKILDDVQQFGQSWSLDQNCPTKTRDLAVSSVVRKQTQYLRTMCYSFFNSTVSPFSTCFHRVDNIPFYEMCLKSHNEEEACSSAIAYMKLCSYINTPLRIPDACVKCSMLNGSIVAEGEFVSLDAASVPQSADIVFIIEAKDCNKDVRQRKKLDEIVQQLNRELNVHGVRDNRYSVVLFGGDGVYNKPRSVVINSNVFTEHHFISSYFDHIPIGNGSLDIYAAISYSAKLIFRPGVSKTFVLLPCTSCQESNMKLDYAILHQLLLENDITLHILMNEEFQLKKTRVNKNLFGLDRTLAYTKKDADELRGDATLRKSVQLPKSTLGYCTPLALETNGTVFSGKKLETEKLKSAKKIATVFAKRVARTAVPSTCKTCECTGHNTGVSYMECLPCTYPTPVTIDYGFDEDEMLSILQPGEDDLFDYTD